MNKSSLVKKNFDHPKTLPPLAFLSLDLTSKSVNAKVIRICQVLIDSNGQQHFSEHLFSNGSVDICKEAQAYHGIVDRDLNSKPTLSSKSFNFKCAKNIVVWDGRVTKAILRNNRVIGYSPIIDLQSLARHLEATPKSIRMDAFAAKYLPHKKIQLEILLRKPENKVNALLDIFDFLSRAYLEKYKVNKSSFLVVVGKSKNKKEALINIDNYLKIWEQHNQKNNDYLKSSNISEIPKNHNLGRNKKVITVNLSESKTDTHLKNHHPVIHAKWK